MTQMPDTQTLVEYVDEVTGDFPIYATTCHMCCVCGVDVYPDQLTPVDEDEGMYICPTCIEPWERKAHA